MTTARVIPEPQEKHNSYYGKRKGATITCPVMKEALGELLEIQSKLPEAIQRILDSGITVASLSRTLAVKPNTIHRWRNRRLAILPREQLILQAILKWSERLKGEKI